MDGIPALELWDVMTEVLHSSNNVPPTQNISTPKNKPKGAAGNCRHNVHNTRFTKEGDRPVDQLSKWDYVTTKAHYFQGETQLYIFEDNEAVIKMIIKGRSQMMRHVSRTHRVAWDWLFGRRNLDTKIQIKHVDTKNKLADMLTEGSFTRDEWCHLLCLVNIVNISKFSRSHFRSVEKTATVSKRIQERQKEDEFAVAKPMSVCLISTSLKINQLSQQIHNFQQSNEYAELSGIGGEPAEFEWHICPGQRLRFTDIFSKIWMFDE